MVKKYTGQEIDKFLIRDTADFSKMYASDPINYKGNIKVTNISYIEYIAKILLDVGVKNQLKKIIPVTRKSSYKWNHNSKSNNLSNRREEIFAKNLKGEFPGLGKVIDYQVPLKNEQSDKAGKIDLMSNMNDDVYLIELKYESEETLLRCVLEIATYYQILDKTKFLKDFNLSGKHIKKAVLIKKNSNPYRDFENLKNMPNLAKLIKELEISVFVIMDDKPTIRQIL